MHRWQLRRAGRDVSPGSEELDIKIIANEIGKIVVGKEKERSLSAPFFRG